MKTIQLGEQTFSTATVRKRFESCKLCNVFECYKGRSSKLVRAMKYVMLKGLGVRVGEM